MNCLTKLHRLFGLFVVGAVAALALPAESQAATPTQDVECTMVLTFCPATGSLTFVCVGDCEPYEAECVPGSMGQLQYCHCIGGGTGAPRYAPCTLVFNSTTGKLFCASFGCPDCGPPAISFSGGCYEVYCLC